MTTLRQILGKNIASMRSARGWSQNDLAEMASTSYVHISRIENGKSWASDELLMRIAKAFKTPPELLFAGGSLIPPEVVDLAGQLARACGLKLSSR